jgi:hypothetical protein
MTPTTRLHAKRSSTKKNSALIDGEPEHQLPRVFFICTADRERVRFRQRPGRPLVSDGPCRLCDQLVGDRGVIRESSAPCWRSRNGVRGGDVVIERCRRILNDCHRVPALLQGVAGAFAAGPVRDAAADQHNIPNFLFLIRW